ncbi:MAG: dephospho-CoA kinase [Hyphomonadaceae bacterium]
MIILGLTGSIGMGKSATAQMFREEGVPVYDADATVHALYQPGGAAIAPMRAAFPEAVREGAVDRAILSRLVVGDADAMRRLEEIVHPLVNQAQRAFLDQQRQAGAPLVVLDIPLLLEGQGHRAVDAIAVVSAPADVQRERVLARPGMSEEKFAEILKKQMPDAEKRALADFVIDTSQGFDAARAQVRAILDVIREPV